MAERVRNGLLARVCLEVLRDTERPLAPVEAIGRARDRIGQFSPYELATIDNSREVRWDNALSWHTGDMATVGWTCRPRPKSTGS
jgi:hypothetical protein